MAMPIDQGGEQEWLTAEQLKEIIGDMLPVLLIRVADRIDKKLPSAGEISAYWVGNVLRIDIKPYE